MKKIKLRIAILTSALCLCLMCTAAVPSEVYAATWSKTMSSSFVPSTSNAITLKAANATVVKKASNVKQTTFDGSKVWNIKIANENKSQTNSNILTLKFPKAATIRGRYVDVTIDFTSITIGAAQSGNNYLNSDGYTSFARATSAGKFGIGGTSATTGRQYKAKMTVTTKVTITWNSDGTTVNLPFYQGVSDIDAGTTTSYYKEAWEGVSGYAGTFYIWSGCKNSYSGNKMTAAYGTVDGNDSWIKAGLIAPTTGGTFTARWTEGTCVTGFYIYNQYKDLSAPTKTVDKTTAVKGDDITWTIGQKIGTFKQDTFTTYTNFSFSDTLPEGVTYKSAKMLNGTTDITSQGTLTYDEATRKVTFTIPSSLYGSSSFYKGQTLYLKITATADAPRVASKTIQNTAATVISGYSQNTKAAAITITGPALTVSKKADKTEYESKEKVSYTVQIEQTTAGLTGNNIVVTDALPEELSLSGTPQMTGVDGEVSVKGDTWTASIPNLPSGQIVCITFVCDAGVVNVDREVKNTVSVSMDDVDDISASDTITLTPIPIDIAVNKTWSDKADFYNLRPDSVKVILTQDGTKIDEMTLTAGTWEGTFKDLPQYRTETEKYVYEVKEESVNGYTATEKQLTDTSWSVSNALRYYPLTIKKTVYEKDFEKAHGDATFLYEIKCKDSDKKWRAYITFSEDDLTGSSTASKEAAVQLPAGTYTVTEIGVLRYSGSITEVTGNAKKISDLEAQVTLNDDNAKATVSYTNNKIRWDKYSHNDYIINVLKGGS